MLRYFLFGVLCAFLFARLEIQIEGKDGWAGKLPTWRKKVPEFRIIGQEELTGYHLYLWSFLLGFAHSVFLFIPWSFSLELHVLSFLLFVILLEDFLWFILNPAFGLKRFNRKDVSWHKTWVGPVPFQYITGIIIWSILFYAARWAS